MMISTPPKTPLSWEKALALVALSLALGGCGIRQIASDGSLLGLVTPYRIDIVQGNAITREQLALVKPGMTRAQVREILGTPLLNDPFHAERWDYLFYGRRRASFLIARMPVPCKVRVVDEDVPETVNLVPTKFLAQFDSLDAARASLQTLARFGRMDIRLERAA